MGGRHLGSNSLHVARARQLLAHEGASFDNTEACAAAAERLYEKLSAELSPLLGAAGVRALFVRSGKLAGREFAVLGDPKSLENFTTLRERLHSLDPKIAAAAAAALFGTFFALISTFIGDRLTTQVLLGAWPTMQAMKSEEIDG